MIADGGTGKASVEFITTLAKKKKVIMQQKA